MFTPLQDSSGIHPFRIYTMQIDGKSLEKAFPHPEGLTGPELEHWMNQRFSEWLKSELPGGGERRAAKISFTDRMQERSPASSSVSGPPSVGSVGEASVPGPASGVGIGEAVGGIASTGAFSAAC